MTKVTGVLGVIINYPGPGKIIDMDKLKAGKVSSRHYRNRRIGEFLKEIDLAEKKATGITKILNALKNNGSPPPEFETDEERNYLTVTIHRHEIFESHDTVNENVNNAVVVNVPVNVPVVRRGKIIEILQVNPTITADELADYFSVTSKTIKRDLVALKEQGRIVRVGSDKAGHWEIIE